MVNSPVWVNPVYGWGWTNGGAIVDTPDRFLASVIRNAEEFEGVIQSGDLKGRKIEMSKRHAGPFDGQVNVTIHGDDCNGQLFGFAEISKDLME